MSKNYKITVQAGQNIADIAMQEFGNIDALLKLCLDNGLELGADIEPGMELIINPAHNLNKKVTAYYNNKKHKVASGEVMPVWILQTGFWRDKGIWIDTAKWID